MKRIHLFILFFAFFSTHHSKAKGRYDKPSEYPFGVYGGMGITYYIGNKVNNGDEYKFSITFPPELGLFGGYKFNRYLELRSYVYWDMIAMKLNSRDHDFLLKWKKHNINLDLNFNIFLDKNIHQYYLLFGFDFYSTLGYSYEAENSKNIPYIYNIAKGLGGIDKVDSLYDGEEKPKRIGAGINLGSGFIFDSGLILEFCFNIDFALFNILSSDKFSLEGKGPEAEEFNQMTNNVGKPFFKLRLGYDLSNLLP